MLKLIRAATKPQLEELGFTVSSDLTSLDPNYFAKVVKFPPSPCHDCPQKEKITEINCDRTCERYLRYSATLDKRQKEFDGLHDRASIEKLVDIKYTVVDKYGHLDIVMSVDPLTYAIQGPTNAKFVSAFADKLYEMIQKGYVRMEESESGSLEDGIINIDEITSLDSLILEIAASTAHLVSGKIFFLVVNPSQSGFFSGKTGFPGYSCQRRRSTFGPSSESSVDDIYITGLDLLCPVHICSAVNPKETILLVTAPDGFDEGPKSIEDLAIAITEAVSKGMFATSSPVKPAIVKDASVQLMKIKR